MIVSPTLLGLPTIANYGFTGGLRASTKTGLALPDETVDGVSTRSGVKLLEGEPITVEVPAAPKRRCVKAPRPNCEKNNYELRSRALSHPIACKRSMHKMAYNHYINSIYYVVSENMVDTVVCVCQQIAGDNRNPGKSLGRVKSSISEGLQTMKTITAIATAGLVTLGFVSSACAGLEFTPKHHKFTASGSITVTAAAVSIPCTAALSGKTDGTTATITGATFSGLLCTVVSQANLPWKVTIANIRNVVFDGVEVNVVGIGICGPANMPVHSLALGEFTIAGANLNGPLIPCTISGTLPTKPLVKVMRK